MLDSSWLEAAESTSGLKYCLRRSRRMYSWHCERGGARAARGAVFITRRRRNSALVLDTNRYNRAPRHSHADSGDGSSAATVTPRNSAAGTSSDVRAGVGLVSAQQDGGEDPAIQTLLRILQWLKVHQLIVCAHCRNQDKQGDGTQA